MSEFRNALDYLHDTLSTLREAGVSLTASRQALSRLSVGRAAGSEAPNSTSAVQEAAQPSKPAALILGAGSESAARAAAVSIRPELPPLPAVLPPRSSVNSPVAAGEKSSRLDALRGPIAVCEKCPNLARSRTQTVFGVGNPEAELMFVGEAPGEDEDLQGEPFVGKAGQLLTKIIAAMGFDRSDVFIANVLKCRPDMPPGASGNRKPVPAEMETCLPYLRAQIDIIRPRVLVALGATAVQGLIGSVEPMARLRNRWHDFQGTPLMPTYHPAYLLRNQSLAEKRKVWEDMLMVLEKLGRPITEKQQQFFLSK